jgi:hypothetical protein
VPKSVTRWTGSWAAADAAVVCGAAGADGIIDAPERCGWRRISVAALGAVATVLAIIPRTGVFRESFVGRSRSGCAPGTTLLSTIGTDSAGRCGASRGVATLARVAEGAAIAPGGADIVRAGLDSADCDTPGPESAILLTAPTCGTGTVGGGPTGVGAANSVGDGSEGLDEGVAAGEASA